MCVSVCGLCCPCSTHDTEHAHSTRNQHTRHTTCIVVWMSRPFVVIISLSSLLTCVGEGVCGVCCACVVYVSVWCWCGCGFLRGVVCMGMCVCGRECRRAAEDGMGDGRGRATSHRHYLFLERLNSPNTSQSSQFLCLHVPGDETCY